ncbi:hypothetical protein L6452_37518 [Arctium lappa]|uniref:Uncharacterized protein n=1 Tax=Arctium lappa TaxID=4217 RepID=A0ACB8Y3P0_ARCLA|nr:hypothetical protein L6452_37518 [Arctium lappa]
MSATDGAADVEIAAVAVDQANGTTVNGVEDNGVVARSRRRRHRRGCSNRHRRNIPLEASINDYRTSLIFTDAEDHSSAYFSASVGSSGIFWYNRCHGVYVSEEVDLESGELEAKVHSSGNYAKQCRICHLNFERGDDDDEDDDDDDRGYAMELGCDCKGDLGTAHQKCAVTWFLIKGSLNCEICGAIAQNLCFQPIEEVNYDDYAAAEVQTPEHEHESVWLTEPVSEPESSVYSHWFVNGVLTCMVLAFVIYWLVHYHNSD